MKNNFEPKPKLKVLLVFNSSPFGKLVASLLTKSLLLLTFSFSLLTVSAQTEFIEIKFDSLVKANERYVKEDLTKLKLLNQLAKGYEKVNPAKGIETAELALSLAQKLNNPLQQAAALHYKADNVIAKGDARQAMVLYEQAMAINENYKNDYGISENLRGIGWCYFLQSDLKKARENYDKSLAICEKQQNKQGMAAALGNIGNVYYYLSDYSKALEYYQEALKINEQLGNKSGMANNLGNIGLVYNSLSEYPNALEYHQKALSINEQLGNKSGMAMNLGHIGNVYTSLSDYPKALEYHQKAFSINEQLGNKSRMAGNLGNIGNVYTSLSDYPKALEYYQKSFSIHEQFGNKSGMAMNLGNIGIMYYNLSEYPKALEYYQKSFSINEQLGNKSRMAGNLGNIGSVYSSLSDYPKALEYHQKALSIHEQLGDKIGIATNFGNIGNAYAELSDYPKALEYYQKARSIHEQLGNKSGMANNLVNTGIIWCDAPDSVLKQMKLNPNERFVKALEYQNRGLQIAKEIGNVNDQKIGWQNLSSTYEKQGDYAKAYEAYKEFIVLRDSVIGVEVKNNIQRKEMQFAFEKKETELKFQQQLTAEQLEKQQLLNKQQQQALAISQKEKDLQRLAYLKDKAELEKEKSEKEKQLSISEKEKELLNKEKALQSAQLLAQKQELATKQAQRNLFIAGTVLMLLLAGSVFVGLKRTQKEKKISDSLRLQSDKLREQSDNLLHNILPEEVAGELKRQGSSKAKQFANTTVLFTDFADFTNISEKMSPEELVAEIDFCFKAFDEIIERNGLEKIKTIGDAYMAASGLPNEDTNHAINATKAALEIKQWMLQHKQTGGKFEVRIGLSSGPVVAGIVGNKKFQYDIWGDTVNTASRMESSGEVGKVNISHSTYELIKDDSDFTFESRGKIAAKGKGEIDMYFASVKS